MELWLWELDPGTSVGKKGTIVGVNFLEVWPI